MALPVTPRTIKMKLMMARDYYAQKERCLYCDVLAQELNKQRRLVAENSDFAAFIPFASRFPFEACVLAQSVQWSELRHPSRTFRWEGTGY